MAPRPAALLAGVLAAHPSGAGLDRAAPRADQPGGAHGVEPAPLPPGVVHGHPGLGAPRRRLDEAPEFRSTIGSRGWGQQREGDRRYPSGVFEIKVTVTTTPTNPGRMPWRQRRVTSVATSAAGPNYNTWLEIPGVTSGDRPSMRSGWVLDFNRVRLRPGVGPRPVPGRGSGILYRTSRPGRPWAPTAGCIQVGDPRQMRWLLTWLRPSAAPRVVQER